jgi:hypothetical protein
MTTGQNLPNASRTSAAPHADSAHRIKSEVEQLRTGLQAWSDQALIKFRESGIVPVDVAAGVIQELTAVVSAERLRAAQLEEALRSTKSGDQSRDTAIARLERELHASREAEAALLAAATKARAELKAVQQRSQQIIDEQALQLLQFKRELADVASEVQRARAGMAAMHREPAASQPTPQVRHTIPQVSQATPQVTDISERRWRPDVIQLEAIDAALADSPPVSDWPRVAV